MDEISVQELKCCPEQQNKSASRDREWTENFKLEEERQKASNPL